MQIETGTHYLSYAVEVTSLKAHGRAELAERLHDHGPLLLASARLMTLDDHEAQDLVQATFEIALRRLDTLRDPVAMPAWLLRIQTREAFRVTRRLRRLVRLDRQPEIVVGSGDLAGRSDLRRAMATLPARTRAAVTLRHLAGLSVRDTAEALGVSENTVKTQLKTGLARLREELRDG
jgi:RNA polymerase sigma factor (sigma-70 family)